MFCDVCEGGCNEEDNEPLYFLVLQTYNLLPANTMPNLDCMGEGGGRQIKTQVDDGRFDSPESKQGLPLRCKAGVVGKIVILTHPDPTIL